MLIIGGYGTFGRRIARALVRRGVPVVIAGRHGEKARSAAAALGGGARGTYADARQGAAAVLRAFRPGVLVNASGPFQLSDYRCAEDCIRQGVHYVDLADGRGFVAGITALDAAARRAGVAVISGAGTFPGLSSAVLDRYAADFSRIDSVRCGITLGQRTERGLAATRSILAYAGKMIRPAAGDRRRAFGWQDVYRERYPRLGVRWMANCDVPDLDLLPRRYGIAHLRMSAGLECPALHFGVWLAGWSVRAGLPAKWSAHAPLLLRISRWFDAIGSDGSGMHVTIAGTGRDGRPRALRWHIVAEGGDGSEIPCVPSILLASDLASPPASDPAAGNPGRLGAHPCVGIISLEKYLSALLAYRIRVYEAVRLPVHSA